MLNLNLNIVGAANKPIVPIGGSPDIIPTTTTTSTSTTSTTSTTTTSTTTTSTTTTSTTTTTAAPTTVDFFIVAGGGGGGESTDGGGGAGGAGGLLSGSLSVTSGSYTVSVGGGGAAGAFSPNPPSEGSPGTDSYIQRGAELFTAIAGGFGGGGGFGDNGGNGGSGGGGSSYINERGVGGTGTAGQGFNGGNPRAESRSFGGGGGGAKNAGSEIFAGEGIVLPNGVEVSVGGNGAGTGVAPTANTGNGGEAGRNSSTVGNVRATAGASGRVLIRYSGTPVGTGGTITESGGFTFHSFTSSGTFGWPV